MNAATQWQAIALAIATQMAAREQAARDKRIERRQRSNHGAFFSREWERACEEMQP